LQWEAGEYKLNIENCSFPGYTLNTGWLPDLNTNINITNLRIQSFTPTTIGESAFKGKSFQNISYLTLVGKIEHLKAKCFGGLEHLEALDLIIEGEILHSVATETLNDVPNLKTLQISSHINDEILNDFLWNVTLEKLTVLSIKDNYLKELKSGILTGLTSMLYLDAESSGLRSIGSNIIASSASTIQKINFAENELESLPADIFNINAYRASFLVILRRNKLKTLPEGIFNEAIKSSRTVTIQLENNDWHCDCDLAWLHQLIMNKTILLEVDDNPVCESPTINKGKLLIDADFSDCITANTPSTTLPSTLPTTASSTESTTSNTVETTTDSTTSSTMETMTTDSITSPALETTTTGSTTSSTAGTTTDFTTFSTAETFTTSSTASSTVRTTTTDSTISSATETTTTDITTPFPNETVTTTENAINNSTTPSPTDSTDTYKDINCTCTTECNEDNINILTKRNSVELPFISFKSINIFNIEEDDHNKKLKVQIQADDEKILVWMNTDDINNIHCNYAYFTKKKRDSLNILIAEFKTKPNTSYTICAISKEVTISPLNCRAYTTLPSEENRPWLLNNQQTMILVIFGFALLVTMIVGGVIIYNVVRHNPALLDGNDRVVVVKHRAAEVLVMPNDYIETDPWSRRTSETSHDTAQTSETSYGSARSSKTSYVTAIVPTPVQLIAWKFNQMWERLMANGKTEDAQESSFPNEPPPLPPYSKGDIT
jgi:hypothetical protein